MYSTYCHNHFLATMHVWFHNFFIHSNFKRAAPFFSLDVSIYSVDITSFCNNINNPDFNLAELCSG